MGLISTVINVYSIMYIENDKNLAFKKPILAKDTMVEIGRCPLHAANEMMKPLTDCKLDSCFLIVILSVTTLHTSCSS